MFRSYDLAKNIQNLTATNAEQAPRYELCQHFVGKFLIMVGYWECSISIVDFGNLQYIAWYNQKKIATGHHV